MKVNVETMAKKVGVSAPTLRKWIYANENELMKNKVVAIIKSNKMRNTIRILNPDELEKYFFRGF